MELQSFDFSEIIDALDEKENTCNHLRSIQNSGSVLCIDCGLELQENFINNKDWKTTKEDIRQSGHIKDYSKNSFNIFSEIENLGYSNETLEKTHDIYNKITEDKVYRGNMRNAIIICSLFYVIKTTFSDEKQLSISSILKNFGIVNKKCILKGLKIVNLKLSKNNKNKYISVKDLIKSYLIQSFSKKKCILNKDKCLKNVSHSINPERNIYPIYCQNCAPINSVNLINYQYDFILDIFEKIKNKSDIISRSRPQSITNSIIYYYFMTIQDRNSDIIFNVKEFSILINLSELTLNKLSKEIGKLIIN